MSRVGQNHMYTVYIRYFWLGNHQTHGVYIRIYTVLANPTHELNKGTFALSRFNFTLCQCCCCTQIVVPLQDAFSGNNLVWDKKASSEVGAVFERLWDKKASSERKVLCTTGRVWRSAACVCGHNGEKNGWYGLSGGGASG